MPAIDIPFLGTLVLCLVFVSASYAFATSLVAARGRPQMLASARYATYATCALICVAVFILGYAFQTHDFRIRYVARYSDRSMPVWYLVASLWGGQDGSLLWWTFLLGGWSSACTAWMRGRFLHMQPYILATLMSIVMFFGVLMLFAANPFSTTVGFVPADGEGLNPLLQNYWMMIHPPTLYMGFVGWSVPFAIVIAALITGDLGLDWIRAVRKWVLGAWLFLSVGLLLGMLWSYEELGWGGYWAWDPVENASFHPWLVGTAFLHSIMIQERYGMMKVWNVFLLCTTFILTIFGTFLTRSGLIASVHSFARSDIGIYFAWYMLFLIVACVVLIVWRLPKLAATHRIQSLVSREFAFLLNNWILLAMVVFVVGATTFPLISEWLANEKVTVGPAFYNAWMVPFGIILLALAGVGPLVSWRKATGKNLLRAFAAPTLFALAVAGLHYAVGPSLGFPPVMLEHEGIYITLKNPAGRWLLDFIYTHAPVASTTVCAFVLATVVQEFQRGMAVRMKSKGESPLVALVELVSRARRRYGGYIVHVAVVLIYFGFTGAAYDVEAEGALDVGERLTAGSYEIRYDRARFETDPTKRAIIAEVSLYRGGERVARMAPAKFIYRVRPDMATTEVAIYSTLRDDVYVILSQLDPENEKATIRAIERPLVVWIWIGGILLIIGSIISVMPTIEELLGAVRVRTGAVASTTIAALLLVAALGMPQHAEAQSSSLHAGTVVIHDPDERRLFSQTLCQCGDCARLALDSCICSWAENARADLRNRLANGETVEQLVAAYRARYGGAAVAVPDDEGLGRALWAIPVGGTVLGVIGVVFMARRWKRRFDANATATAERDAAAAKGDDAKLDAELEDELKRLDR